MRYFSNLNRYFAVVLTAIFLSFNGCSKNPATGERHFNLISESQEIEMGKQADEEISTSMGVYNDQNLQNYIQQLGSKLAAVSERPNLKWTFRVIDDPIVNAFAIPGGYVYVTRGILSHLSNEAELAGVMGHEIGHVTAKHTVYRMSSQELTQLGVGIAMILKPELQQYSQLASLGLGLLFLKFSRDDEREADKLGVRYMTKDQYDPAQMMAVMKMLDNVSSETGGSSVPQWLSTHPTPENRIDLLNKEIASTTIPTNPLINKNEFISKLDNLVYGENPEEGYFINNTFYQPQMKFLMVFPEGWQYVNQKQAVIAVSKNQDAIIQLSVSPQNDPNAAANQFFSQQGINSSGIQATTINGNSAATGNFSASTDQGDIAGNVTFLKFNNATFQILSYAGAGVWNGYSGAAVNSIQTFRTLTEPRYLNVSPKRMKIVTIEQPMTLAEFNTKFPSTVDIKTLSIINQADPNKQFPSGTKLKQVIGEGVPK